MPGTECKEKGGVVAEDTREPSSLCRVQAGLDQSLLVVPSRQVTGDKPTNSHVWTCVMSIPEGP